MTHFHKAFAVSSLTYIAKLWGQSKWNGKKPTKLWQIVWLATIIYSNLSISKWFNVLRFFSLIFVPIPYLIFNFFFFCFKLKVNSWLCIFCNQKSLFAWWLRFLWILAWIYAMFRVRDATMPFIPLIRTIGTRNENMFVFFYHFLWAHT